MFINSLCDSEDKEKIVLIYTNIDQPEKFFAGVVQKVFEEDLIINHYLPNGMYDGYIVKKIEDIYRVDSGSKYVTKMEILKGQFEEMHVEIESKLSGISSILYFALKNQKVVSIELYRSGNIDATGYISQIIDGICEVELLDDYGFADGVSRIYIDSISQISCDCDDEIILKKLAEFKNK